MKNTVITFYDTAGEAVQAKTKPFISAKMIVEATKIQRKYTAIYEKFLSDAQNENFDVEKMSDMDFWRVKKVTDMLDSMKRTPEESTIGLKMLFDTVIALYAKEIAQETVPLVLDKDVALPPDLQTMLNDSEHALWEVQDLYSFRDIFLEILS